MRDNRGGGGGGKNGKTSMGRRVGLAWIWRSGKRTREEWQKGEEREKGRKTGR